jgi:hypothetical protein
MIRHVVVFAWVPDATDQQKQRVADDLRKLPPLMTGLRAYHFGPDAGIIDGNFDFAVVDQVISPIVRQRAAIQYEL